MNTQPSARTVLECVLSVSGLSRKRLLSQERKREVFFARMAYAKIRRNAGVTVEQIGKEINRDHSTVSRMIELHSYDFHYTREYHCLYQNVIQAIQNQRKSK
ncbi:MAG: hypothetical protein J6T22_09460 [Bacteroidales bacterium]|nr:hypothetical protein [Bacteroidales bacterium]MBO7617421.1 hypothetical protein [Bacteroidales bacterium]